MSRLRLRADAGAVAYLGLVGLLGAFMVSQTVVRSMGGSWVGDFWEHSAVVRELAHHLVHPQQPLLGSDEPHPFFSPYALVLGATSRVTHVSSVVVLGAAGILNLILLVTGLHRFVKLFSNEALAPFFTLFFALVLWGSHPLDYSGFLHLHVLGLVLPYPSTFATALALWTCALWADRPEMRRGARVAAVAVLSAIVLLTHPVAAAFLGLLLLTTSLQRLRRDAVPLGAVGATTVIAAAVWPYYPFFRLLHQENIFDASNRPLYEGMLQQVLPALVGVPLLAARMWRNRRDALALTFAALVVLYAIGDATSRWSFGRVLPYGVLILDLVLADPLAARLGSSRMALPATVIICAGLLVLAFHLMHPKEPFVRALPRYVFPSLTRSEEIGSEYSRLFAGVPRNSVTMATEGAGREIPSYGGSIVAAFNPQAFVPSEPAREHDIHVFFDPATTNRTRRMLLCRYGADYLLVDEDDGGVTPQTLAPLGMRMRTVAHFVLFRVEPGCSRR